MPESIDYQFLHSFKQRIRAFYKNYRFVVVCGGGALARMYIKALKKEHKKTKELAEAGIRATRMHALLLMHFFGAEANSSLPLDMHDVKVALRKNNIVFCGGLRFVPHSTSDGTAARLAHFLKSEFINLTNVDGYHLQNPATHPASPLIVNTSWQAFEKATKKIAFHAGQHFVLDQEAARLIRKHKIRTYILNGKSEACTRLLAGKSFKGTTIAG